jgi:hypothetical protein
VSDHYDDYDDDTVPVRPLRDGHPLDDGTPWGNAKVTQAAEDDLRPGGRLHKIIYG